MDCVEAPSAVLSSANGTVAQKIGEVLALSQVSYKFCVKVFLLRMTSDEAMVKQVNYKGKDASACKAPPTEELLQSFSCIPPHLLIKQADFFGDAPQKC